MDQMTADLVIGRKMDPEVVGRMSVRHVKHWHGWAMLANRHEEKELTK